MIREIWYEFMRFYVRILLRLFYKNINVEGIKNLPKNTPMVFAPNHQNAFMDALMVVAFCRKKIWFLTRADIFKKPLAIFLLNSLRMTPIYRQRDGVDSLEKNKGVFHKCYLDFNKGETILVFPEGNHQPRRTLRALSKGTARIAFGYEDDMGYDKELAIIPTGITYSEPSMYKGSAKVFYNQPIFIQDYINDYRENPAIAMRNLTTQLKNELEEAMLDIPATNYEVIDKLLRLDDSIFIKNNVFELQQLTNRMADKLQDNPKKAEILEEKLKDFPIIKNNKPSVFQIILSILLIPIYLSSFIAAPFYLAVSKVLKNANDEAFKSSLKLALTIFLGVPYLFTLTILSIIFVPGIVLKIAVPILVLNSFFIFLYYTKLWRKIKNWKYYALRSELLKERASLIS